MKVIDVSDPANPEMIGRIGARPHTDAEDIVVRSVNTASFTGDLAAIGIQRCGGGDRLDEAMFGTQYWDVTDPAHPEKLGSIGFTTGDGGTHELDLFQRGSNVYSLNATPFSEAFDSHPAGEFRIVDVTDPANPVQLAAWGAIEHGLAESPFDGLGNFGVVFDHSVRASADGTKAFVSYWDLGVLTFDITDPADPRLISQTEYPFGSEGELHSVSEYGGFLLANDEDFDTPSPALISYGDPPTVALGNESSPFSKPLWKMPGHTIEAPVARARQQGCDVGNYPSATRGAIAVVKTVYAAWDPSPTERRMCRQGRQEEAAIAAGAVAVVHDWVSAGSSPQWWTPAEVGVPVLFTDHETALGMVEAGEATLEAQEPSWGYLRVFDADTGEQVAKFDELPYVHTLTGPLGFYSIHNNEVWGDRSFASWYTHGIVALDLSPLGGATPADPVMVGQFVPSGAASNTSLVPDFVPAVWGVFVRQSDGLIFASDLTSGLWIVRPTGNAAPWFA